MESTSTFHILELQCRECFRYLHFHSVSVMGENIAFIYLLLHKNVPYTVEL